MRAVVRERWRGCQKHLSSFFFQVSSSLSVKVSYSFSNNCTKSESVQIGERLSNFSAQGWILDGIPETREQALLLQTLGIAPRHVSE